MKKLLQSFVPLALAAATLVGAGPARADDFPGKKPITIVVPFVAGGPTDRVARDFAQALGKALGGANVIVDNYAGAGGSIGANRVARAPADGYTLLVHHIGMATMPTMVPHLPFNVQNDFEYLGLINDVPMTIIARPTLPANNMKELASWVKANSGKINLGNAGVGSASHLCGLMFEHAMGAKMTQVPYKGTAPAMTDLIGGQIDLMCDQTTNTSPHIISKKVKAFAVTTPKRLTVPGLDTLPTMQELGYKDFSVTIFHGLYAPKGTPAPILKKLNAALKVALKDPTFIKNEETLGAVVVNDKRVEPAEHKKFVAAELARWTPVLKAAGVHAE